MTNTTMLVLGGTGKTGRRVAERLRALGIDPRIGSRGGSPPFEWNEERTWEAALSGVRSVYVTYQPDLAFTGAVNKIEAFSMAAVEMGARRLVLLSGRNEPGAFSCERLVQELAPEWTIVRSSFFAQNFSESFLRESVLRGELAFPAGNVSEPFIDVDDIADIVVAALIEDRHLGELYEVTGPRLLTFEEAAKEIGVASKRAVRYFPISHNQFAETLKAAGLPDVMVGEYIKLLSTILDGRSEYTSDGVQRALGRDPRDFREYARNAAASGAWDVPALSEAL